MNNYSKVLLLFALICLSSCKDKEGQTSTPKSEIASQNPTTPHSRPTGEPWTEEQLMEPAVLAQRLKSSRDLPVILSLGAGNIIPGSKDTGATGEKAGLENLKKELEDLPKDTEIVLYCGCCPFNVCPNVRPAFSLLNEKGFTNHHLLNLPENIKVDWIDKGYAVGN